jgi:hypothetical protein
VAHKAIVAVTLLLLPGYALGHSSGRGLVLLLPTELYLIGGALAVLASFILLAVIPPATIRRAGKSSVSLFVAWTVPVTASSLASLCLLVFLLMAGFSGSRDPLLNPLPIFTWTLWWVLFTVIQCITGDLWRFLNPWSGLCRLLRRSLALKSRYLRLPAALGYMPATILFAAFAWFELVDRAPEDPERLGWFVLVYWVINFTAILVFGEKDWFQRGEPFSIFFRLIGAIAPLQKSCEANDRGAMQLVWPGRKLTELPALPVSGILFVLVTLATVSFDGLSRTFLWLKWTGVNPLEFPGRSALTTSNSIGLVVAFTTLSILYLLVVCLGHRLAGSDNSFMGSAGRLVYSIIPVSLVFHCSHYLVQVLVNSQYAVLAFNDPFAQGWNMLGAQGFHVTTSFLNNLESVVSIWGFQTMVIVIGHIIGIAVAHAISLQLHASSAQAIKSQVFLAIFMVAYTLLGLWLLSTAAIG